MSADAPPPPDLSGRTVGDFQVLRKIGQGGMGQVYLARQLSLKRQVALKILRDDSAAKPTALQRFQAEAEAVARISHPNVVQVYAAGEHDGLRFMALEYVDGRNLRDHLDRKGPPDLPVALAILKQVAAALQRAAESGIVHRDVKPENILLTRKVEVKVTDFGLSRYFAGTEQPLTITQSGMTLGTPLYMSPEQVQGKPADHRSDLYSLGVTAYHLLAGTPPFKGETAFELAVQHVQREAEPLAAYRPDLPADLCALVHRLMAKNPADRPPTAKDVIRDLVKIQKGLPVPAPPTGSQTLSAPVPLVSTAPSGEFVPRLPAAPSRWPWRVAAVLLAGGVAAGGWWLSAAVLPSAEVPPPPSAVGLPEVKLPAPPVAAREAALRERVEKAAPHSREQFAAAAELGLLLVDARRLDDADRVFKHLEATPVKGAKAADTPVSVAVLGKFGQAVVLAHQDKWAESNRQFAAAVDAVQSKGGMKLAVEKLCFDYPEVGQAIAEAVNRNADNMPKGEKPPANVLWLRTPNSVMTGPK